MKTSYRRRPSASRLERLLARLLLHQSRPESAELRVDFAHADEVDFRRA